MNSQIGLNGFVKSIVKEYPRLFPLTIGVMAISGLLECMGIALFIPLLSLIFPNSSSTSQEIQMGLMQQYFTKAANLVGIRISLSSVLVLLFTVFLAQGFVKFLLGYLTSRLHVKYNERLINRVFSKYFEARWPFFYKNNHGKLVNNITAETERTASALQWLVSGLSEFFLLLFYLVVSCLVSWKLTFVGLIAGVAASFLFKGLFRKAEEFGKKNSEHNNLLQSEVSEKISAAKFIKASATEEKAFKCISRVVAEKLKFRFKSLMNSHFIPSFFQPLVIAVICVGIYYSVKANIFEFSTLLVFLALFYKFMPKFQLVQYSYQLVLTNLPAYGEIMTNIHEAEKSKEASGEVEFSGLNKGITFKNVGFCYEEIKDERALELKNINLLFEKNRTTALVGSSGSGKSTIVDLILGLVLPNSGDVLVDECELSRMEIKSWRKRIGYVTQDVLLFNDTVENNIAWATDKNDLSSVKRAAKKANASEFIEALPQGYKTVIGDRGVKLSGGQRQRISLARALMQEPEILILDEATSALDAESENIIKKAIEDLTDEMTVIVITHRLSTVTNADKIYVIEQGVIVEEGSWDELVSQKGRFEELGKLQSLV